MSNHATVPRLNSLMIVCEWLAAVLFSFAAGKQLERGADYAWWFVAAAVLAMVTAILFTFRGPRPKSE